MDVSPYLMRRLRTLDEVLEAKGITVDTYREAADEAPRERADTAPTPGRSGGRAERPRLTLVASAGKRFPPNPAAEPS